MLREDDKLMQPKFVSGDQWNVDETLRHPAVKLQASSRVLSFKLWNKYKTAHAKGVQKELYILYKRLVVWSLDKLPRKCLANTAAVSFV